MSVFPKSNITKIKESPLNKSCM